MVASASSDAGRIKATVVDTAFFAAKLSAPLWMRLWMPTGATRPRRSRWHRSRQHRVDGHSKETPSRSPHPPTVAARHPPAQQHLSGRGWAAGVMGRSSRRTRVSRPARNFDLGAVCDGGYASTRAIAFSASANMLCRSAANMGAAGDEAAERAGARLGVIHSGCRHDHTLDLQPRISGQIPRQREPRAPLLMKEGGAAFRRRPMRTMGTGKRTAPTKLLPINPHGYGRGRAAPRRTSGQH